jgi:hypothetical protein
MNHLLREQHTHTIEYDVEQQEPSNVFLSFFYFLLFSFVVVEGSSSICKCTLEAKNAA